MIQQGSQVFVREKSGDGNVVKTGSVVSIRGQRALVYFPADNVRKEVPVSGLQAASERYPGRSAVNVNPLHR